MTTYTVGRGSGARTLSELDDGERYSAFDQLQERMPHVWDGMRRDLGDESVVVVPSITTETQRHPHPGAWRSGRCSCCSCCASRCCG